MNRFASVAGALAFGLWASVAGAATSGPPIPTFNVRDVQRFAKGARGIEL
jgi:hypothetical protein